MLWLGCGGSIRENPVPNLDCDSAQATGEVRLTPNFANHVVMLFEYGLHQKKSHSRTFAQSAPSGLFLLLSELMDLFVAGRDQSAADQPNNLAEGQPPL